MYRQPHKTKQFFFVLIKLSIVVAAFYFIYDKLTNNTALKFFIFIDFVSKTGILSLKTIIFLAFLSTFNWFLEILKWKILVASLEKINIKQATEHCLCSLTASLFTPNRIGEYGAKALCFSTGQRKKVMLVNLIGNLLQMAVTIILGAIGLYFFIKNYQPNIDYTKFLLFLTIALIVIVLIGFVTAKSNLSFKGFSAGKFKDHLKSFPKHQFGLVFLLSVLRYAIFSFQFYFLLQLFDIKLNYFEAMTLISSMYILASVIPSIFIFDVVVKGSVAVYLFAFAGVSSLVILSIVTIMWIFNFVLPSILGSYYVLKFQPKNALS
ncbi:lysylphosphatidylglycerol synthase domain-containing protein [Flavisericum labens]|uniref:lysylphosphatidylglycerol synthase domain-containing protein n=1 Tax=Flavisericum labens TaxID=3377112 RepID=UPI00387B6BEF